MDYAFSRLSLSEALNFMKSHNIEMFAQHGRRFNVWRGSEYDYRVDEVSLDEKPFVNNEFVIRASLNVGHGVGDHFDLLAIIVGVIDARIKDNEGQHSKEAD